MYEQITIVGNIGSVEVVTSKAQEKYIRMSVGVNRGTGEKRTTTWYNVILYGEKVKNADSLMQYLTVGRQILVNGRPQTRPYTKNDGTLAVDNTIHANALPVLLDNKTQT